MLNREPAVVEDIYADARIPHDAYRRTFVCSLVMVGFAQWDGEDTAGSLVCRADEELYRAKREGRDGVAFGG